MAEKKLENKIEPIDSSIPPVNQTRMQNVLGMFQTVDVAPTKAPFNWQNQIQIFKNGGTLRLYWYDVTNNAWHYVTASA